MGAQYQLFVFMGRLTHQKGGDLIAAAAKAVLASNSVAQARVPEHQYLELASFWARLPGIHVYSKLFVQRLANRLHA